MMLTMLKPEMWVEWIGATVVAAAVAVSFAFGTFQTKGEAKEAKDDVIQRLMRLESKMDVMLERGK